MNIKNYLHLYLGCRVKTTGGKFGTLVSVSTDGMAVIVYDNEDPRGRLIMKSALLPILRPLSDMTEEDMKHVSRSGRIDDKQFVINCNDWEPEHFLYLLSKHFDLFGLIDAGLAIDKTKQ